MSLLRKQWTPSQADEWTVHDFVASVLAMASYVLVAVGVAGALLLQVWGFVALGVGTVCIILMYFVIDPKLKALSEAFAKRQQQYLEDIDKTTRWER